MLLSQQQAVASFQASGGTAAVCPACGAEIGLTPADLIPGAVTLNRSEIVGLLSPFVIPSQSVIKNKLNGRLLVDLRSS